MPQASIALGALTLLALLALIALELRRIHRAGELERRAADLERAVEDKRRGLEGRYCIVNTRRPDDQSIRGWVRRELEDGSLELAQAAYLEPADGGVNAVDAGDVHVPASSVSWVQLDVAQAPASDR